MTRCPITYETCLGKYGAKGIHLLSKKLTQLKNFPFSAQEQVEKAIQ